MVNDYRLAYPDHYRSWEAEEIARKVLCAFGARWVTGRAVAYDGKLLIRVDAVDVAKIGERRLVATLANELAGLPPIVVTRHGGLVDYLKDIGRVPHDVEVVPHATAENVLGRRVIGVLPNRLAASAFCITEVSLDIPPDLRGKELSKEQVGQYATGVVTYVVNNFVWESC